MANMILVVDADFGLAKNGSVPWMFSEDLRHFRQCTLNKTVVMGINTFFSLPNGALANRKNCIISRNKHGLPKIGGVIYRYYVDQYVGGTVIDKRYMNFGYYFNSKSTSNVNGNFQYGGGYKSFVFENHRDSNLYDVRNVVYNSLKVPYKALDGLDTEVWPSLEASLVQHPDAWIIGGANLANYALEHNLIRRLLLTIVHRSYGADLFLHWKILTQFKSKLIRESSTPDGSRYFVISMTE